MFTLSYAHYNPWPGNTRSWCPPGPGTHGPGVLSSSLIPVASIRSIQQARIIYIYLYLHVRIIIHNINYLLLSLLCSHYPPFFDTLLTPFLWF